MNALDSFWMYCRQQDRLDEETRFQAVSTPDSGITEAVVARNALLLEQGQALERQVAQMAGELAELRDRLAASDARRMSIETGLFSALAQAEPGRIHEVFGWMTETGRFDARAYLEQNPDVAQSGMTPIEHFIRHGLAEGRRGGGVDPDWMLRKHAADLYQLIAQDKAVPKLARLKGLLTGARPARGA